MMDTSTIYTFALQHATSKASVSETNKQLRFTIGPRSSSSALYERAPIAPRHVRLAKFLGDAQARSHGGARVRQRRLLRLQLTGNSARTSIETCTYIRV